MMSHPLRVAVSLLLIGGAAGSALVPATSTGAATQRGAAASAATGAWSVQSSGTRQPLFAVSCFNALRCKAVGAGGTIEYTKNGGATWHPQANPLAGSSTVLYRIACVAPSTCYVIGRPNIVLVTHNGGAAWSARTLPVSVAGLTDPSCVSEQSADLRERLTLCRLGLLDLACITASTCYVVATIDLSGQPGILTSAVFLTTDGGSTWTKQRIPAVEPCLGPCGHPPAPGKPYPLEWISCGSGLPCRSGGSIFLYPQAGYASLVIEVREPGTPWTQVRNNFGVSPNAAVCPTVMRCYGVWSTSPFDLPGNGIWLSTNGGGMWLRLSSGSPRIRNAIACPGPKSCYSVGNQGTITASLNGSPFVAQPSQTSHDLYGVTCVDLSLCFAVGNVGTIVARISRATGARAERYSGRSLL
jgi:hypothetical protein